VKSGQAGRIQLFDWRVHAQLRPNPNELAKARGASNQNYVLAVHIHGDESGTGPKANLNVAYVADMDLISDYFVDLRNSPIRNNVEYISQNMSFVLNLVDHLAGEESFLEIRNKQVSHVTLKTIDNQYEIA